MLDRIHVYDLDGVLVDTSHRYRNKPDGTIDLPYWFAMRTAKNIAADKPLPLAKQYASDCKNPHIYTVICTSRAQDILDIRFIYDVLGAPNKLIMRPVGNMDSDGPLKRRALQGLFNLRQFRNLPRRLWEDNRKNIDALSDLFTDTFLIASEICEND